MILPHGTGFDFDQWRQRILIHNVIIKNYILDL